MFLKICPSRKHCCWIKNYVCHCVHCKDFVAWSGCQFSCVILTLYKCIMTSPVHISGESCVPNFDMHDENKGLRNPVTGFCWYISLELFFNTYLLLSEVSVQSSVMTEHWMSNPRVACSFLASWWLQISL